MSGGSRRLAQDPMARLNQRLNAMESRLNRLNRSPRLPQSSQRGGSQKLLAPDGTILFEFGDYIDTDMEERYGVVLYDDVGNIVQATDENAKGLLWPGDNTQWGTTTPVDVTSGVFVNNWSVNAVGLNGDAMVSQGVMIIADGATTGEVRMHYFGRQGEIEISGYSNVVNISYGSILWQWRWLHPFNVGLLPQAEFEDNLVSVWLEVRRTAGTGTISVYRPRMLWVGNSSVLPTASEANPLSVIIE